MNLWQLTQLRNVAVFSALTLAFIAYQAIVNRSVEFWYLPLNLMLAWTPLGLSIYIAYKAKRYPVAAIACSLLWLAFLPNAFYLVTDIIHIGDRTRFSQSFDSLVLVMCAVSGFLAGLLSLSIMDRTFLKKLQPNIHRIVIFSVSMLIGMAIYIGREMRWNSWELVTHPLGILQDLAYTLSIPRLAGDFVLTTMGFSVMITISYYLYRTQSRPVR